MSSSDSDDSEEWILYSEREEWKDVTGVEQDDGPYPVVSIAYSEKFKDVFDYFRAVLKTDEKSERALELTKHALELNAANYTVWNYRREILKFLQKDLYEELEYISEIIRKQPKNYQVWYHRGIMVDWLKDSSAELEFIAEILKKDAKNYHAWQHRQWVLNEFKLWDQELDFITQLLGNDLRNNSAWNQRYYCIRNTTGFTDEVVSREKRYTLELIEKAPNNESAWNYLRGLLEASGGLVRHPDVREKVANLLENNIDCPYVLSFLVDYNEETLEQGDKIAENLKAALELCDRLATDVDCIRKEYWNYVARSLKSRFGQGDT